MDKIEDLRKDFFSGFDEEIAHLPTESSEAEVSEPDLKEESLATVGVPTSLPSGKISAPQHSESSKKSSVTKKSVTS